MMTPRLAFKRYLSISRPRCSRTSSSGDTSWHPPVNGHETGINVYNCVTRSKVPLVLRHANCATWYSCGPTVYDASHIGHGSCYVKQDILQRILRQHFHINLTTAMNITDVDDKIIAKSEADKIHWKSLVQTNEASFWKDLSSLGCARPNHILRVSDHIPHIIKFIQNLIRDGFAYCHEDGSVYFDVTKYPAYGKLQHLNLESVEHESKRNTHDFALWKGRLNPSADEPHWSTPWSKVGGRPGWHIECSAMATHLFGHNIDFHSGGLDLRFPHHENEEAQSCAHHNCDQWVNYWIHIGQLHVVGDESKMSKSLNNTIGISELLATYSAAEFRMACLLSNHQNQMDFSAATMNVARAVLQRLQNFSDDCKSYVVGAKPLSPFSAEEIFSKINTTTQRIDEALRDNFNTSKMLESMLDIVTYSNKRFHANEIQSTFSASAELGPVLAVDAFIKKYSSIVGLNEKESFLQSGQNDGHEAMINQLVSGMMDIRSNIRRKAVEGKNKELFTTCDQIRDLLQESGIRVKDTGNSSTWSYSSLLQKEK